MSVPKTTLFCFSCMILSIAGMLLSVASFIDAQQPWQAGVLSTLEPGEDTVVGWVVRRDGEASFTGVNFATVWTDSGRKRILVRGWCREGQGSAFLIDENVADLFAARHIVLGRRVLARGKWEVVKGENVLVVRVIEELPPFLELASNATRR